jgi:hypothetical protein
MLKIITCIYTVNEIQIPKINHIETKQLNTPRKIGIFIQNAALKRAIVRTAALWEIYAPKVTGVFEQGWRSP